MIVPMRKITIVGLKDDEEKVLGKLQEIGKLHLIPVTKGKPKEELLEDLANLRRIMEILTPYEKKAKRRKKKEEVDWKEIGEKLESLLEKKEELKVKKKSLLKLRERWIPWGGISLSEIKELGERGITLQFFILPRSQFARLDLKDKVYKVTYQTGDMVYLVVFSYKEKIEGYAEAKLPEQDLTDIEQEIAEVEKEIAEVEKEIALLSSYLPFLREVEVELLDRIAFEEAKGMLGREGSVFMLQGWTPAEWVPEIKSALSSFRLAWLVEPPKKGEDVPVILKNKPVLEPFQLITELHSQPSYDEIDTTVAVAPFFAIFFGMCLGDAGYGLILFLLSSLALKLFKKKLTPGLEKGLKLFRMLTLFVTGFGLATGTIFSINWAPNSPIRRLIIFDPSNKMRLFALALFFGLIQISVGVILKAYKWYKDGLPLRAIGNLGYLGIIWGATAVYLGAKDVGFGFIVLGAILVIGLSAYGEGVFKQIGLGLWGLYGATGFLGDLLSYSRLFALSVATGIIASVVNDMAAQFKSAPYIGWPLAILILVLGHGGNIALGLISGFVHTLRLQFVEFYKQFYEGGGLNFESFRKLKPVKGKEGL